MNPCANCLLKVVCIIPCEKYHLAPEVLNNMNVIDTCRLRNFLSKNRLNFILKNNITTKILIPYGAIRLRNNIPHRKYGPSMELKGNIILWHYNGKLHRMDGPAVFWDGLKEWWINGIKFSKDKYCEELQTRNIRSQTR